MHDSPINNESLVQHHPTQSTRWKLKALVASRRQKINIGRDARDGVGNDLKFFFKKKEKNKEKNNNNERREKNESEGVKVRELEWECRWEFVRESECGQNQSKRQRAQEWECEWVKMRECVKNESEKSDRERKLPYLNK